MMMKMVIMMVISAFACPQQQPFGLDWTGMPRRFEEYVLDDPNAEREREEIGKVLLRLLFFAKIHVV